jgi:hypothetical protein
MLRLFDQLVRFVRRHSPGGRDRLAYQLLQSIVVEPEARMAPARRENERPARSDYTTR